MKHRYYLILSLLIPFLAAACGQKGPLYLPAPENPAAETPAIDPAAEDDEENDGENP